MIQRKYDDCVICEGTGIRFLPVVDICGREIKEPCPLCETRHKLDCANTAIEYLQQQLNAQRKTISDLTDMAQRLQKRQ